MRKLIWIILLHLAFHSHAQQAMVLSFEHSARWVSESSFPNYTSKKETRDSIYLAATNALQKKLEVSNIRFPETIQYRYYSGFGKAELKWPKSGEATGAKEIIFLSFITRSTVGFGVLWKMQIMVRQGGNTVFTNEIEHELEYFSTSGYMNESPWMDEKEFARLFGKLFDELLGTGPPLDAKIIIGSVEAIEKKALAILPDGIRYDLKTGGGFLTGTSFDMRLLKGPDTLTNVLYKDGWESSQKKNLLSEIAAGFAESVLKVPILYTDKTKEKRFGRLLYSNGEVKRLRLEWVQETKRSAAGDWEGPTRKVSPMVAELYSNDSLTGYFTFYNKPSTSTNQSNPTGESKQGGSYLLKGILNQVPVEVSFDPYNSLIQVNSGAEVKMILVLVNIDSASRSSSGEKLSRNKVFVTSGTGTAKSRNRNPESYWVFTRPVISESELNDSMEAMLCFFFGLGNGN